MVPKDNSRRKLDSVNASFCPPSGMAVKRKFLLSHFSPSAKVSKVLLITKTSLSLTARKQETVRKELKTNQQKNMGE